MGVAYLLLRLQKLSLVRVLTNSPSVHGKTDTRQFVPLQFEVIPVKTIEGHEY